MRMHRVQEPIRGFLSGVVMAAVSGLGCGPGLAPPPPDFDVMERSIVELTTALDAGEVTSRQLVTGYLDRIAAYDQQGPGLNAMVQVSDDVWTVADTRDAERAEGQIRGPLHGVPVVVKDNYDIAGMPTSAGTIGLATSIPPDDAFQVRRLREAGAIILGKTNMHELARGITTVSSILGQTRNPYDPSRNPGGSSGGTGAAVAASYAAVGMGSDTCGSIRIPSAHHALVGLRGTRGLASGDGIIPLSSTQDIGGPLARSVEDLAITLDVTVGPDPADETTQRGRDRIPATFADALDAGALRGARVALLEELLGATPADRPVRVVIEAAATEMSTAGAELVDIGDTDFGTLLDGASLIGLEFKFDFDRYLAATPGAAVRSLAELVERGLYHQGLGAGALQASLDVETLDSDDYRARLAKRTAVRLAVEALLDEHELTALIYPTIRETARPVGQGQPGSNCALSAVSGLPAITVPAGYATDGMPVGLEMIGREFSEADLLGLAYAFEQLTAHRQPPYTTPSLVTPLAPEHVEVGVDEDGGVGLRARFFLDPGTRRLRYRLSVHGLMDGDVLFSHLHRAVDGAAGPVTHLLGGRAEARVSGTVDLSAADLRSLRDGDLYVDVHTRSDLDGVRADIAWPAAGPDGT